MRKGLRCGTLAITCLLAIFGALNTGCGGSSVTPNAQVNQGSQASSTTQAMQVPTLGFAYAAGTTEVRSINGISGASTQGSALNIPANVSGVSFSPGQKYAIAQSATGGPVGAISFQAAEPSALVTIAGAISQPDIIAFSPTGVAAALYSS